MSFLKAIFLGVVQGVTEFLPVSSSGHLVLAKALLGIETPGALWEVVLHVGTLAAIMAVLRRDVARLVAGAIRGLTALGSRRRLAEVWAGDVDFRMSMYILLGVVPAGIAGVLLEATLDRLFSNCLVVGCALFVTGGVLWLTRSLEGPRRPAGAFRALDALLIGLAQVAGLVPGVSRAGVTISAGLGRRLNSDVAARFSFLMVIPAILGALFLKLGDLAHLPRADLGPLLVGCASSAVVGFAALVLVIRLVDRGRLHWFAPYCWIMGVLALAAAFMR